MLQQGTDKEEFIKMDLCLGIPGDYRDFLGRSGAVVNRWIAGRLRVIPISHPLFPEPAEANAGIAFRLRMTGTT